MSLFKRYLKYLVSACMLGLVLYQLEAGELHNAILSIPASVIPLAILGYATSLVISSLRWRVLAQAAGLPCPPIKIISTVFVGAYANCFGFGTLGGDMVKAILISRGGYSKSAAFGSVAADRLLGVAVLALLGVISGVVVGTTSKDSHLVLVSLLVALAVPVGWVLGPKILEKVAPKLPLREQLMKLASAFPQSKGVILHAIILAVAFHISQIILFGAITRWVGLPLPWSFLFLAMPLINIASTLPLSWMGLGIRESLYVFFFAPQFMNSGQALMLSAIWFVGMLGASGIGGVVAVLSGAIKAVKQGSDPIAAEN